MANAKPALDALLRESEGGKILFLGREGVFTKAETERYLKRYGIARTENLDKGVVGVVEHHSLNPVEEEISYQAYDQGIPLYKLGEFEQRLSGEINDDELLMAVKLGNDQERIVRLIKNPDLSDLLFVKLLEMYGWHHDEEDNVDDREVIMATLRRYIKIKPNEEDLLYSPLTLKRLSTEATDPGLLYALIGFPDISFLQKGKQKITLRENIAANRHIDPRVIKRLLGLRQEGVDMYLAANENVDRPLLESFAKRGSQKINAALASNGAIDDVLFHSLLSTTTDTVAVLLWYQPISLQRYEWIKEEISDWQLFAILGENSRLDQEVIVALAKEDNLALLVRLCKNETVSGEVLRSIYGREIVQTHPSLARNPMTPADILEVLYQNEGNEPQIARALAYNAATPEWILRTLYERDIFEINEGLASNPSTPMELLHIFKIDTRLRNALTTNETFVASITRSLGL